MPWNPLGWDDGRMDGWMAGWSRNGNQEMDSYSSLGPLRPSFVFIILIPIGWGFPSAPFRSEQSRLPLLYGLRTRPFPIPEVSSPVSDFQEFGLVLLFPISLRVFDLQKMLVGD